MQARLHAARPALCHRVQSAAVRVCWSDTDDDDDEDDSSMRPALYPLVACMAMCLPRLEELSLDLDLGNLKYTDQEAFPSILAPLAGLPHLARLSVLYPGGADIQVFQAGQGGSAWCIQAWLLAPV